MRVYCIAATVRGARSGERLVMQTVEAAGLRAHLDAVLATAGSGTHKPDPVAYEIGAAYAGGMRALTLFASPNG